MLRLIGTQDPLLLLEVPEPSLLRLTDQGQKIVESYLSQGIKMLEGAEPQLQEAIKKSVKWLVVEIVVGGVVYDVLKGMVLELSLADLSAAPLVTPGPPPIPEMVPSPVTTPRPPKPALEKPGVPDWVVVPQGYALNGTKEDRYFLISKDLIPKKITNMGAGLRLKDTGWGTYTVYRISPDTQPT